MAFLEPPMLGEEHFSDEQGVAYEYAVLPYLCGDCELTGSGRAITGRWELTVPLNGEAKLFVHTRVTEPMDLSLGPGITPSRWSLVGQSEDQQWSVRCEALWAASCSSSSNWDHNRHKVVFDQGITLKRIDRVEPTAIRGWMRNLDLSATRPTTVHLAGRDVSFAGAPQNRDCQGLLKKQVVDRALLSMVTVPIVVDGDSSEARTVLDRLGWMATVAVLQSVHPPVVEELAGDETIGYAIRNTVSMPYRSSGLIDLWSCTAYEGQFVGFWEFFRGCYDRFAELDAAISFNRVVSLMMATVEQKYPTFRLAGLLMCYERFCADLLTFLGDPLAGDPNVEQKLNRLHKNHLKLDKHLRRGGSELRKSIRNPLMHEGLIEAAPLLQQLEWFNNYWDQFLQILLIALQYQGQYLSPITHIPTDLPASPLNPPQTLAD